MSRAKKTIRFIHLWLGLACGLVVLVVTLTGCILVFEEEIDEWMNKDFYFAEAGHQRLPSDSLLQRAQEYDTAVTITSFQLQPYKPQRTAIFIGKKGKQTSWTAVNPFTGKVIRSIVYEKRFFTIVLQLHRYLCLGNTGKVITGVSCLIFLSLVITGLVLWWPRKRKYLQQRLRIKWKGTAKRINWGLHAVGGFYVHFIIFIIALTGLTWSYKWFNDGIFQLFDGRSEKKFSPPANTVKQPVRQGYYEHIVQQANHLLPYQGELTIIIPPKDSLSVTVSKLNQEASITNVVDFLYFEKGTGRLLQERLYKNATTGMKVRRIIYPIHTGNIYGWPTKLLAFIACLVAFSLPITGFCLWLNRKRRKKRPIRMITVAASAPAVSVSLVEQG